MPLPPLPIEERRRFPRAETAGALTVHLLRPEGLVEVRSTNVSEAGLCFQVEETLEVRSLVRLQLMPQQRSIGFKRSIECTGRVAWVVQRLDLRDMPPFVFDVGVELIDPPRLLQQWLAQRGGRLSALKGAATNERVLEPATIKGRRLLPRLERSKAHERPWHLVVTVEGVPCFSGHYPSERAARQAWSQYQKQQTR